MMQVETFKDYAGSLFRRLRETSVSNGSMQQFHILLGYYTKVFDGYILILQRNLLPPSYTLKKVAAVSSNAYL